MVGYSPNTYQVNETVGSFNVSATRTTAVRKCDLDFITSNGTAISGTDYTAVNGEITWTAESGAKTVSASITNRTVAQASRKFAVDLSLRLFRTADSNLMLASLQTLTKVLKQRNPCRIHGCWSDSRRIHSSGSRDRVSGIKNVRTLYRALCACSTCHYPIQCAYHAT